MNDPTYDPSPFDTWPDEWPEWVGAPMTVAQRLEYASDMSAKIHQLADALRADQQKTTDPKRAHNSLRWRVALDRKVRFFDDFIASAVKTG